MAQYLEYGLDGRAAIVTGAAPALERRAQLNWQKPA